jgi:phage/conjugal plasmid C-4 type zinc finger TraR family protein
LSDQSDFFDRASKNEADFLEDARKEQARRAGLEGKTVEDSALHCQVCGDEIPEGRREAYPGTQTCVTCQADLERAINP